MRAERRKTWRSESYGTETVLKTCEWKVRNNRGKMKSTVQERGVGGRKAV